MSPLNWLWWRRSLAEPSLPAPVRISVPAAVVVQVADAEMPPPETAAGAQPLPGRGQEPDPGAVLSSDPEACDLFLAGIHALETMARWRRDSEVGPFA